MELRQLRCFIAVAETLHFGRAAQQLDLLPAALGRDIKQLEESLGTRLLTRSTRHVALTDHGRLFLGEARKIIADTDAESIRHKGQIDLEQFYKNMLIRKEEEDEKP